MRNEEFAHISFLIYHFSTLIRVVDSQFFQDFYFQRFHLFLFFLFHVVVALQMKYAVDEEVGEMVIESFFLLGGFAFQGLEGHYDIA